MFRRIMTVLLACLLALPAAWTAAGEADPSEVTYLDLGNRYIDFSQILILLEKYPKLEKVDMFATPVWAGQIEELTKRFPQIEFGWTIAIGDDHRVRTDATAFSTLHLSGSAVHNTREISLLRYCKNLKALDFGHNSVNDISWLSGLTELRVLIIAINRVEDLSPLANLKKLEYLEIFNNYIKDLSPLTGLTHLMDLNISYNLIEDYSPLYEMTSLKRLWMYNSRDRNGAEVPPEVLETLHEKLPDCQIDSRSMPTLGGWREHPHFDVIHEMFRSPDGYQPFEDSWPEE